MRLFFTVLFGTAFLGLACGIIALFQAPSYALALLTPSVIYISAFLLAYTFEESQNREREHRRERELSRLRHSSRRSKRDTDTHSETDTDED